MTRRTAACLTVAIAALSALGLTRHPLHTTLAVFTVRTDGSIAISVRAFADDLGAVVRQHAGDRTAAGAALPADGAMEAYTRSAIRLTTGAGRPVPLVWCGARREGDLAWICLETAAGATAGPLRLRDALLVERFDDQVNIVQVVRGAHRTTVLFTKGDGAKPLDD